MTESFQDRITVWRIQKNVKSMQAATLGILQHTESLRASTAVGESIPIVSVRPGADKSQVRRAEGATTHSHRPPDWIWALAVVRPGHQTSDCA